MTRPTFVSDCMNIVRAIPKFLIHFLATSKSGTKGDRIGYSGQGVKFWIVPQQTGQLVAMALYQLHAIRDQSRYAPSQWEMSLPCNDVSHWLGAYLDGSLLCPTLVVPTEIMQCGYRWPWLSISGCVLILGVCLAARQQVLYTENTCRWTSHLITSFVSTWNAYWATNQKYLAQ